MTPARLLDDLRRRDVRFSVNGDLLKVDAPKGVITSELVDALKAQKAEIIRLLSAGHKWDSETAAIIEWFLSSKPPSEPFKLYPAVTVLDPARWWESIRVDIAGGPGKGRAYHGALQKDLSRLAELFGGPKHRRLG